jgi:predicted amidohydrolase
MCQVKAPVISRRPFAKVVADMREPLTVAVAQPRRTSYDVQANAMAHAAAIRATDAHVVAFPELSMTGYELDAEPISLDDPLLTPIVEACAETDTARRLHSEARPPQHSVGDRLTAQYAA